MDEKAAIGVASEMDTETKHDATLRFRKKSKVVHSPY